MRSTGVLTLSLRDTLQQKTLCEEPLSGPLDHCRLLWLLGSRLSSKFCGELLDQDFSRLLLRPDHTPGEHNLLHAQLLLLGNSFLYYTHQLHNFNCQGINLCNAYVSLVSACLASMISQKGNYTTRMLGELISEYTHTSYTSIIRTVCNGAGPI